ncbi:MAG: IS200/IS605 family transposase [Bacteroidales bacterium]|nr:MAG: IS200/IS605 family transposase [Bacteroidales bacterium]
MSWVRIWVHLVFSTKNGEHYLNSHEIRVRLFEHIKQNALEKDIRIESVNGYQDHVHCLISLGKDQTISNVAKLIKGESSFWINQQRLIHNKFAWQDDYWAVGVSESHLDAVRNYIYSQEEHHKKKTFTEEVNEFMEKYGWALIKATN